MKPLLIVNLYNYQDLCEIIFDQCFISMHIVITKVNNYIGKDSKYKGDYEPKTDKEIFIEEYNTWEEGDLPKFHFLGLYSITNKLIYNI